MSVQPSVAKYFNSRKRPADDCKKIKNPSKVFVLDNSLVSTTGNKTHGLSHLEVSNTGKRIVYPKTKVQDFSLKVDNLKTLKTKEASCDMKKELSCNGYQMGVWKNFQKSKDLVICELPSTEKTPIKKDDHGLSIGEKPEITVQFHIKGLLSPAKRRVEENKSEIYNNMKHTSNPSIDTSRKELNLKAVLSRSSRLEEIKKKVKMFNENKEKLEMKLEQHTPAPEDIHNIMLEEVSSSPLKTPTKMGNFGSPQGKITPRELFKTPPRPCTPPRSPLKSPIFKRYEALVTEGRPALILPYKYKSLAELFRCVDTVASMMHNRKEAITLTKLCPAVREMSLKKLTEYQLGQIKTVFPGAFKYTIIKKKGIGASEKYELSIEPQLSDVKEGESYIMGPSVLLARRRVFYNALLELVKDCHEEFLRKLSPPMSISRALLTRWHPDFPVDDVPDVQSMPLPQPPTADKITSAKEMLEKARNLFVVNPRMQRALQKVAQNKTDGGKPSESTPAIIQNTAPPKSALTGVPASLLERVRAKQAARALEAMTRTPAQAQEAVRFTRLPEIARIVRNLFVTEKKSVLLREQVLSKLADSFRENLSRSSLDDHLKLLAEQTPGWITFCNLRKTEYVKLSRDADMNRIMTRLESLAADKCI